MIAPQDFLNHAKGLIDINNNPTEIDCRSAISRAYYSLFHEASNFLEAKGRYQRTTYKPHEAIKNILVQIDPIIGLEYDTHKDSRREADYNLRASVFTLVNSDREVREIESFILTVKRLPI